VQVPWYCSLSFVSGPRCLFFTAPGDRDNGGHPSEISFASVLQFRNPACLMVIVSFKDADTKELFETGRSKK
jgi:hypothetical protein